MSLSEQQWCPTNVQVTVLQARGLRAKGKSGTNDAYAIMQVGRDKYQTSVVEKTVAPVWTEEATFDLPPPSQGAGGGGVGTLHVHVLHRALVGPDKQLGQAVINLLLLSEDLDRPKTQWFRLLDKAGKPDKDRGEVLLDIKFTRTNMTSSMFDLSAAGKSRSRLSKLKDKVRNKKKDSGSSSSGTVPSFSQVLTDSEEDDNGDGEVPENKTEKIKKQKIKSLFSTKTNLQKNMSQSMLVLPAKNSSLSSSQSSGLNTDSSTGKKKFKFNIHKRSGSSDGKDSAFGHPRQVPVQQSNLCINGSHIYCEEPHRTARISSSFSLMSSGHESMEDVPENSLPSVDPLKHQRQHTAWMEEENEEADVYEAVIDEESNRNKKEESSSKDKETDQKEMHNEQHEESRRAEENFQREEVEEEEMVQVDAMNCERMTTEIKQLEQEEQNNQQKQKRKREEEERFRRVKEEMARKEEEERVSKEEMERTKREEEERARIEEVERLRKREEERAREEERVRKMEEERTREEEEERARKAEEERVRKAKEERVRKAEEERVRKAEEERVRKAEEERVRKAEEERVRKAEEERVRKAEEERVRKSEEERVRKSEEERVRKAEEESVRKAEEERVRKAEEERVRKAEEDNMRKAEEESVRKAEEERVRKAEEESMRKAEEVRVRKAEEEKVRKVEEERVRKAEEERVRKAEEEKVRKEESVRKAEEERVRKAEEEKVRKAEEESVKKAKEERAREKENFRNAEEERVKKAEEERARKEEIAKKEEEDRAREAEEERAKKAEVERARKAEEERVRKAEEERARKAEEERARKAEERARKAEEERAWKAEEDRVRKAEEEGLRKEEEERLRKADEERTRKEESLRKEEEDRVRKVEEERARKAEEESLRKKEEDMARKAEEKTRRKQEEKRSKDEIVRNEVGRKAEHQKMETKKAEKIPAESKSTNPFDEDFSSDPEKILHCSQREKRVAPQPPGKNLAEERHQEESQCFSNNNKQRKEARTVSVHPQRSVHFITPLSRSQKPSVETKNVKSTMSEAKDSAKPAKRPAPSIPHSEEQQPSSKTIGKTSQQDLKQVHGLNPFEDDEDELPAEDDAGVAVVCWPPLVVSQTADSDATSYTKTKSLKVGRAPAPPPPSDTMSISSNTKGSNEFEEVPDKPANQIPEVKTTTLGHDGQKQPEKPLCIKGQDSVEAGAKKEGPPTAARRLQPVKPLNPVEQHVSDVQGESDCKSAGILSEVQDKTKEKCQSPKGPFSQLTREELISLMLKQEHQLSEKNKKILELEQYIDKLLVRVIEEQPSILLSLNSVTKAT